MSVSLHDDSVPGRFLRLADEDPTRRLFVFVGDDGREEDALTVGQLRDRAAGVAIFLRKEAGLRRGDRALLVYPPSLDFVVALVGCMFAGVVPVPVAPPNPMEPRGDLSRLAAMAASSGARVALSNKPYLRAKALGGARDRLVGLLGRDRSRWPELPWHATDGVRPSTTPVPFEPPTPSDLAALQYTSGSTAFPRGVMITHGNLSHQLACNAGELGIDHRSRAVFWVPHFHDFGLISGIASALHGGVFLALMSPLTFLRRPELWIEQLSKQRATHTAAPNFAYDLVVRKTTPEQRARWDLRALKVAMSAAEPVRDEVVRAFCAAFAPAGFREEAFCPAYGLAEHTVGVSVMGRGRVRVDRDALERDRVLRPTDAVGPTSRVLVGCGRPSRGVTLRVVDPTTRREVAPGQVGELWVDSPSKAAGYFGLEDETRATFRARLDDASDATEYLRTGDLGALVDGEIYVVGRRKDLIILRGRNVYPQDVEDVARDAHPALKPGGVAAFSVERADGGGEQLVLFVESRDASPTRVLAEEIAIAVRRRLGEELQLACETVVVGVGGLVRKTTSGKVRRAACRQAYLAGELPAGTHAIGERATSLSSAPTTPRASATEASSAATSTAGDPRLDAIAPSFAALLAGAARYLARPSTEGGDKGPSGIAARGWLEVVDDARPRHRFFAAGARLPILLRHDNRTSADDAAPDARVAALRVLDPEDPTALDRARLDLVLLTGRCFFHRTAEEFFRFSTASPEQRDAMLRAEPHRGQAAWEGVRLGASYRRFHYHSQTVGRWRDEDGVEWWARYRLRAPEHREDEGFVDAAGALFPRPNAPRRADDARAATCLRDDFAARVRAGGVDYVLEVQRVRASDDASTRERRLDATRAWPEEEIPWRPLARLHLDEVIDDAATLSSLAFSPAHAPDDLGVVPARSERESASIDHARTVLYEVAASARLGRAPSPAVAALLGRRPSTSAATVAARGASASKPKTIAVVGAGASGLTLARALERRGHAVTVIERDAEVGGMCQTRTFDGVACDLGGHMIFPSVYPTIVELAREVGARLVPDFPDCAIALDGGRVLPKEHGAEVREAKARVASVLRRARATEPGVAQVDRALALPIGDWIERERLGAIWDWMGTIFVAAGYGYLEDRVPATYLAKSFAHTLDEDGRYQIEGGYQGLWARVAAELRDVRTGCAVTAARRDDDGVTLTLRTDAGESTARFDRLVLAHSPAQALGWLDASPEERALFGRVRSLGYVSAIVEVEGLPEALRGRWCFVPENTRGRDLRGHVLSFVQLDPSRPIVGLVTYAPPDGVDPRAPIAEDFARLGARLGRVHLRREWSYFPHFGAEDVEGGALDRLEALQGARSTWHASTLHSFELTECAAAYARAIARRIDAELGGEVEVPSASRAASGAAASGFDALRAALEIERGRVAAYLQRVLVEELELGAEPDLDAELAALGIDSLRAVSIHHRVTTDAGVELAPTVLAEEPSLRALAARIVAEIAAPARPSPAPAPEIARGADDETMALLGQLSADGAGDA